MIVLDTSVIISILHASETGKKALILLGTEIPVTTALSVFEALRKFKPAEAKNFREQIKAVDILELDAIGAAEAACIDAELSRSGNKIPAMDMLIAGICRSKGASILTMDVHFGKVKGLKTVLVQ